MALATSPTFLAMSTTSPHESTSLTYPSYGTHSKPSAHPSDVLSTHRKHVFSPHATALPFPPLPHNQPHLRTIHPGYDSGILNTTPIYRQISPRAPSQTHNRLCYWVNPSALPCLQQNSSPPMSWPSKKALPPCQLLSPTNKQN
jgi:hypothetical protein